MKRHVVCSLSLLITIAAAQTARAQAQVATAFPIVGITRNQTLQLNLVSFAGGACNALFIFWDSNGNMIVPLQQTSLAAGESASFALSGSSVAPTSGQRVEVLPQVAVANNPPGAPGCVASASAEVFDNLLGITSVLVPGASGYPPAPMFDMVGLTSIETVRLNVTAFPFLAPCVATIGFADKNGNPVGSSMSVNLSAGQSTFVDLPGSTLVSALGQRAEVHPIVTVTGPAGNICYASTEVYLNATRTTVVYYPPSQI